MRKPKPHQSLFGLSSRGPKQEVDKEAAERKKRIDEIEWRRELKRIERGEL